MKKNSLKSKTPKTINPQAPAEATPATNSVADNSRYVDVTEHPDFDSAWAAATDTRESFAYYQGMERKIGYIKRAQRWFVTEDKKLWYSYVLEDGLRVMAEASPYSVLSSSPFQYVQIMVNPNLESNPERKGHLRFSNQYTDRNGAIEMSKKMDIFSFHK